MKRAKLLNICLCLVSSLSIVINSLTIPILIYAQEVSPAPAVAEDPLQNSEGSPEATLTSEITASSEPTPETISSPTEIPTPVPGEISTPSPEASASGEQLAQEEQTSDEIDLSNQSVLSMVIQTDKADYFPADTVFLTGTGFLATETYVLVISSVTGNFSFTTPISANEKGELFYSYQLDGGYRPNYKVEIKDNAGLVLAIASFTDNGVDITPPQVSGISAIPNSFSPNASFGEKDTITISYTLSDDISSQVQVLLQIYSILDGGGLNWIRDLIEDEWQSVGSHAVIWDGTDYAGDQVPDGVYKYGFSILDEASNLAESSYEDTIIVDNTAPSTTDDIDSNWHNSDVLVNLSCTDGAGSGCAATYHTTDGTTPDTGSSITNPFSISLQGTYTVKYFSKDNAGNSEAVKTAANQVKIDKTAPTNPSFDTIRSTSHTVGVLSTNNRITMFWPIVGAPMFEGADDALSGVSGYSYSFTAGAADATDTIQDLGSDASGVTSEKLDDGTWYFHFRTSDNAGNWAATVHKGPYLIEAPPELTVVTPIPAYTSDSTPDFSFSSSKAGTITYFGDCTSLTVSAVGGTNTVTLNSLSEGVHSNCGITVTDGGGKESELLNIPSFTVDLTPPLVAAGTNQVVNHSFTQDATASDMFGIASIAWSQTSGPGICSFTNPSGPNGEDADITCDLDGVYLLTLSATDNAGNSAADDFLLIWDTTNPTAPGFPETPSPVNVDWQPWSWLPATDNLTGISQYFWRVNGTDLNGSTTNTNVTTHLLEGNWDFFVRAQDVAGNFGDESSSSVTVDMTAPTTTNSGIDGFWHSTNVTVNLICDDGLLGVGCWHTYYTTDGSVPTTGSSEGNTFTLSLEGVYTIKYFSVDLLGNTESVRTAAKEVKIDKTAPTATISYSTTAPTGGNVVATLHPSEAVTVTNNGGLTDYTFTANGSFIFEFADAAGKTGSTTATVNNIDKEPPSASWLKPAADTTVSGNVALEVIVTDNLSDVKEVKFQYKRNDGVDIFHDVATDTSVPYVTDWDTTALVLDAYTLRAVVTDNAGNPANFDENVDVAAVVSQEASSTPSDSSAIITWLTDRPTSTRVVYDTISHPIPSEYPNYGYAYSTGTGDTDVKVTSHSITITGLSAGTIYYYRTISAGSPVAVGEERTFKTLSIAGAPAPGPWSGQIAEIGTAIFTLRNIFASPPEALGADTEGAGETEEILDKEAEEAGKPVFSSRNYFEKNWPLILIALIAFSGFVYLRRRGKKS